MDVELDHLPMIDWDACIRIIGKPEHAKEMIHLLVQRLPKDVITIRELYIDQKYSDLWQQLHKLRGALCYIPMPRLCLLVDKLESDLKNNIMDGLPYLLGRLENEVKLIIGSVNIIKNEAPRSTQ